MLRFYPWATVGFCIGAIIGFAWAQSTKKAVPSHVSSDFNNGVVTVRIDAANAARDGLVNLLSGL